MDNLYTLRAYKVDVLVFFGTRKFIWHICDTVYKIHILFFIGLFRLILVWKQN